MVFSLNSAGGIGQIGGKIPSFLQLVHFNLLSMNVLFKNFANSFLVSVSFYHRFIGVCCCCCCCLICCRFIGYIYIYIYIYILQLFSLIVWLAIFHLKVSLDK